MDDLDEFFPRLEPEEDIFSDDSPAPQDVKSWCPIGFDIEVKQHDDWGIIFILTTSDRMGRIVGEVHSAYDPETDTEYPETSIRTEGIIWGEGWGDLEEGLEYCKYLLSKEKAKRE